MKEKFIKISKIWLAIFACVVLAVVGFIFFNEGDTIPAILGFPFLIAIVGMLVWLLIALVLDGIESWKRDKKSYVLGFIGAVAGLTIVVLLVEYFWGNHELEVVKSFVESVFIVGGIRAGEYLRSRER